MKGPRQSAGYIQLVAILLLVSVAAAGGYAVVHTYNSAIEGRKDAEAERDQALRDLAQSRAETVRAEAEKDAAALRHEADIERINAAHDRQVDNEVRKERAVNKANADKIAETSNRDAQRYQEFVQKSMPRNLEALACRSDLRTVNDENACPYTIR